MSTLEDLLAADGPSTIDSFGHFIAHSLWAEAVGQDVTVDDEPTAARFDSFAAMLASCAVRCPNCDREITDGAPICVACYEDSRVLDPKCLACGVECRTDPASGLCVPCRNELAEIEDDARRAALARERRF